MIAISRPDFVAFVGREPGIDPRTAQAQALSRVVAGADPGDEIDLHAEPGQPDRLGRGRTARAGVNPGSPVGADRDRPFCQHRIIRHDVADDEDPSRGSVQSRANSTATCAARWALFLTSAMLAARLRPSVSSTMRPSK